MFRLKCSMLFSGENNGKLLSQRQIEILLLLLGGCNEVRAGKILFISHDAVRYHCSKIRKRLDALTLIEACEIFKEIFVKLDKKKVMNALSAISEAARRDERIARALKKLNLM